MSELDEVREEVRVSLRRLERAAVAKAKEEGLRTTIKDELNALRDAVARIAELVTGMAPDGLPWTTDELLYVVDAVDGLVDQNHRAARELGEQDAELRRLRRLINARRTLEAVDRNLINLVREDRDRLAREVEDLKARLDRSEDKYQALLTLPWWRRR